MFVDPFEAAITSRTRPDSRENYGNWLLVWGIWKASFTNRSGQLKNNWPREVSAIRDFNLQKHVFFHVVKFCKQMPNADNEQRYKFNMVATKHCAWGTCRSDSRYPNLMQKNDKGDEARFYRFPAPKRWKQSAERRKFCIVVCHRGDSFVCGKDSYICSLHFEGMNGPTEENPDSRPNISYSK